MKRNLNSTLMSNLRKNQYNKQNTTVICVIDNEVICKINVVVIVEPGAEKCVVPVLNNTSQNSSTHVEKAAKAITEVSKLDCNLKLLPGMRSTSLGEIRRLVAIVF